MHSGNDQVQSCVNVFTRPHVNTVFSSGPMSGRDKPLRNVVRSAKALSGLGEGSGQPAGGKGLAGHRSRPLSRSVSSRVRSRERA